MPGIAHTMHLECGDIVKVVRRLLLWQGRRDSNPRSLRSERKNSAIDSLWKSSKERPNIL